MARRDGSGIPLSVKPFCSMNPFRTVFLRLVMGVHNGQHTLSSLNAISKQDGTPDAVELLREIINAAVRWLLSCTQIP